MDGLSGIKIYQQIKVDTAYLPTEYPTALKFIIKGVSNKIDSSGWTTSIETVSMPVIDFVNGGENSSTGGTGNSNTANLPPSSTNRGEDRNIVVGQNPPPLTHVNDPNLSQIRNAILRIAKGYVGQSELPERIVNGKNINDNLGFNDKSFEAKMKGVGWYSSNNALWCNWFADLVWKEAYTQVGATDKNIQNIFATKLNSKVLPPLSAGVFNTLNSAIKAGFGQNNPKLSDIKPGDMIIYNYGHINICVAVNQQDGSISTVGGNEGGGAKSRNGGRVVYTAKRNFKSADIKGIVKVIE